MQSLVIFLNQKLVKDKNSAYVDDPSADVYFEELSLVCRHKF
jgi:hypothetical protein